MTQRKFVHVPTRQFAAKQVRARTTHGGKQVAFCTGVALSVRFPEVLAEVGVVRCDGSSADVAHGLPTATSNLEWLGDIVSI
jgi:hypothetical protein